MEDQNVMGEQFPPSRDEPGLIAELVWEEGWRRFGTHLHQDKE